MRRQNIVIFSSGVSESNGILGYVKEALTVAGYNCGYWRDLFSGANDAQNIALLPMLIKKIPTFDFAVLICEGHDETIIHRGEGEERVSTMRDNVLFEIGLCSMALGLNRVILLTDGVVRLPEDLHGVDDDTAVKVISYTDEDSYHQAVSQMKDYMEDTLRDSSAMKHVIGDIRRHISDNADKLYPTIIGASVSTANGYMSNFILRTLEKCNQGFVLADHPDKPKFPDEKIFMHIVLPLEYSAETPSRSRERMKDLAVGCVPNARFRKAEFRYKLLGDELHIYDYPTTLVTEYRTAQIILAINADDKNDAESERRFNAKELDLFESALRSFMSEPFIRATVEHFYGDDSKEDEERMIARLTAMMDRVEILRKDY